VFSPENFSRCDADAVSLAEGRIWARRNARRSRIAGVPSPGHAFTETSRERRRALDLCRINTGVVSPATK
jgi:hypothetical protein